MILFPHGHDSYFLEFAPTDSEIHRHAHDLARANEVVRIGAKFFDAWLELMAGHSLPDIQPDAAFTVYCMVPTEFADRHLYSTLDRRQFFSAAQDKRQLSVVNRHAMPHVSGSFLNQPEVDWAIIFELSDLL